MIDGLLTYKIVENLNNKILSGKIQKIYQINDNEVIFKIRANQKNYNLLNCIEAKSFRLHLSEHKYPTLQEATNFTMVLRKQLEGGIIKSIKQYESERIIIIEVIKMNELRDKQSKYLIFELLARHSNTILTDSDFKIITTMKFIPLIYGTTRIINKGAIYENIDTKDKLNPLISIEDSEDYLSKYQGFSKQLNEEFIYQNSLNKKAQNLLHKYLNSNKFYVYSNIISCLKLETRNDLQESYDDIDEAFDLIYSNKADNNSITNLLKKELKVIKSTIKRNNKKIEKLEQQYLENSNYLDFQKLGTLLYDNIYLFDKNTHYNEVTVFDYETNQEVTIPLDDKYNFSQNAQKYLQKYNKLKRSFFYLDDQIKQAQQENELLSGLINSIDYASLADLKEMINYLENKKIIKITNKKYRYKKQDKPQVLKYNINDATFIIGKNALQNEHVTFKLANKEDYWFHIKDITGSHVILKGEFNDENKEIAARLAVYYAKTQPNIDYEVNYTQVKNIKKIKNGNIGQVTFDTYNSINILNNPKFINELKKDDQNV